MNSSGNPFSILLGSDRGDRINPSGNPFYILSGSGKDGLREPWEFNG
jgi:hypothetical protein